MTAVLNESHGNCAVIRLNRPESLNAINTEMLDGLFASLDRIEASDSRAVIITGSGRGFCPGTDLKQPPSDVGKRIEQVHQLILRLQNFPKLVVAAINGLALGGGLELALACHFRVAATTATLGLPEIKIGLLPSYGGTVLLPRLIGQQRSLQMMLSGDSMSAEQALDIGLLDAVTENSDTVVQEAHDFVQRYCNYSLLPQQAIRRAISEAAEMDLAAALVHEQSVLESIASSADVMEGVTAFIEKRPPVWSDS